MSKNLHEVHAAVQVLQEFINEARSSGSLCELANKHDLEQMEKRIMAGIADFATAQNAFNAELSSDLDAITTAIAALNAQIATLQNSPGTLSAADQATLDSLQAAGTALEAKADAVAGKTPPTPPTA
jgi:hypothetical protein